jgi:hypothetical protein
MPVIEVDPNAERIQRERNRKLVLLSAAIVAHGRKLAKTSTQIQMTSHLGKEHLITLAEQLTKQVSNMRTAINPFSVSTFGKVNISRSLALLKNASNSFQDIISKGTRKLTSSDIEKIFDGFDSVLSDMQNVANVKLGATPEGKTLQLETRKRELEQEQNRIESEPVLAKQKQIFRGLSSLKDVRSSGKSIMELMLEKHAKLDEVEAEKKAIDSQITSLREINVTEAMMHNNLNRLLSVLKIEKAELIEKIKNSGLGKTKKFVIVTTSLVVDGKLPISRFKQFDFDVMPFSGKFILTNQKLIAIVNPNKHTPKTEETITTRGPEPKPPIQIFKYGKGKQTKPVAAKPESVKPKQKAQENQDLGKTLTNDEVLAILKARGEDFLQLVALSHGEAHYELRLKEIPNVRFLWVIDRATYQQIARGGVEITIKSAQIA